MKTPDGGADFSALVRNPAETITAWVVIDDETVITGADAGNLIYKTTRYGRRVWDEPSVPSAAGTITDLAVSPNYAMDGTLLAGDNASQVFISFDEGDEWDEVSGSDIAGATWAGVDNDTYVVFDPRYADNNMVYAASDDIVARVEIDTAEDMGDLEFDNLSGSSPDTSADLSSGAAAGASGMVISDDGIQDGEHVATLYVLDGVAADGVDATNSAGITGGVWRSLNPADDLGDVIFEQVLAGFGDAEGQDFSPVVGAISNLELTGGSNTLYAIDTAAIVAIPDVIYTYTDTLAAPVVLSSPSDGEGIDSTEDIVFEWEELNSDTVNVYQIQVNEEDDFPSAADLTAGTTDQEGVAADVHTTAYTDGNDLSWRDEAASGTEHFWRVRVGQQIYSATDDAWGGGPLLSRWSIARAFTTKVARAGDVTEVRPAPAAQDIVLSPAFSWGRLTGADFYEIEVATDSDFSTIIAVGTSESEAWLIDTTLDYSTSYYWRVRGISFTGAPEGSWRTSIFTTMAAPAAAVPPVKVEKAPDIIVEVPAAPAAVEVIPGWMLITIIIIGAVLVIALIVLIVRTRRVV